MPVDRLFVEGRLDAILLNAVVGADGNLMTIEEKGSKYGLLSKVIEERKSGSKNVFFHRDRDFDYEVPPNSTMPRSISNEGNLVGWHWCRHEIENYLLEPTILSTYLSRIANRDVTINEIQQALHEAACAIRYYQAARWTIGISKRKSMLPPLHELSTRPVEEGKIPQDLGLEASLLWVKTCSGDFLKKVDNVLQQQAVLERFHEHEQAFQEEKCQDIGWVLHVFSGKDLFAALNDWFKSFTFQSAKDATNKIASWVAQTPEIALQAIPEWQALLDQFRRV